MDIKKITQRVEKESLSIRQIVAEIEKVIIGQTELINRMIIGLLCEGHLLLEGLPGLAKTTAVKAMAQSNSGSSSVEQFFEANQAYKNHQFQEAIYGYR